MSINFKSAKNSKVRKGLIIYSILILGALFLIQIGLLLFQPTEALVVDRGISCSGGPRSGDECNVLGYPINVNHMFSCLNLGSGYKCYETPINDGGNSCFLDSDGVKKACGCNQSSCEATCLANNAGKPTGTYTQGSTCNACGQNFTCSCFIQTNVTPTPTPTVTPTSETCPSTQARFTVGSHGLVQSGTFNISEVPPFQTSVLVNSDVNQIFHGNVTVTGPFGSAQYPDGSTRNTPISPIQTGTYTITAALTNGTVCGTATVSLVAGDKQCTKCTDAANDGNACSLMTVPSNQNCPAGWYQITASNQSCTNFVTNGQCPVVTTVTPTPTPTLTPTTPPVSGITINKTAVSGAGPYEVGAQVHFRVTITNTGQTTFGAINFRDQYNTGKLDFLSIINARNGQNVTGSFNVNESTGTISDFDLSNVLGDLQPGANYQIDFYFRALVQTSSTCNDAFIIPEAGKSEMGSEACISINQTPPTDL